MTVALFIVTALAAAGDWVAVRSRLFRLEYVLKPLTLALLLAAAASADLPVVRGWVLTALVLSLLGDVALLVSADEPGHVDAAFLLGIAAFLAAQVCYLAAFVRYGLHGRTLVIAAIVVLALSAVVLPKVLTGAHRIGGQELAAIVGVYATAVGAMTVLAIATGSVLTAVGGALFFVSDTALAWERFVRRVPSGPLIVIVSYHLAQILIVIGLIRH